MYSSGLLTLVAQQDFKRRRAGLVGIADEDALDRRFRIGEKLWIENERCVAEPKGAHNRGIERRKVENGDWHVVKVLLGRQNCGTFGSLVAKHHFAQVRVDDKPLWLLGDGKARLRCLARNERKDAHHHLLIENVVERHSAEAALFDHFDEQFAVVDNLNRQFPYRCDSIWQLRRARRRPRRTCD